MLDFNMNKKHLLIALFISLFSIVFMGTSEEKLQDALQIFNTRWIDLEKGVFVGALIGLVLRAKRVREFVEGGPFGSFLTGVGIGVIGLGFAGIGLLGAAIIYLRFTDVELIRVPLHATVVGISALSIFLVSRFGRNEKI